jgi:hypothetical protein
MNKKELVKLLFKHPTIKALCESPEFDNRMINQAIISEVEAAQAEEEDGAQVIAKLKQVVADTAKSKDDVIKTIKPASEKTAKFVSKMPNNKDREEATQNLQNVQKSLRAVDGATAKARNAATQAMRTPELDDDRRSIKQVSALDSNLEDMYVDAAPVADGEININNAAHVAQQLAQATVDKSGKDSKSATTTDKSDEVVAGDNLKQEKEKYRKRAEMAVKFLNVEDNELFVDDNFMTFLGKVLEKEGVIQEQGEEEENYADKYLGELESKPGDFLLTADEAKSLIETLKDKKEEVNKIIKAAIQASKQPQTDGDQTEASQDTDPDADADVSPMEQEKLDKEWIRILDIFFGKNPESPSFMRRLLLRDQATMLFTMIDTLKKIELGKSADGEKQSLTKQRGKFDNKDEQPTSDKEVDNSQQQTQTTSNPPGDQSSLQESLINEIFNKLFKSDNQEIKISKKTTAFMRQDLESMVNLLQSLKADIKGYERFATRSSSDPRYDGTTLKAAMDGKLETTQKSIAHLIKVIDVEIQNQINQLGKDAQQVAGGDTLQEDRAGDRKLRIEEVKKVYNELRRMYLKGLRISLENPDTEKAKSGAKQMREYVMSQEKFMSYFPTNIISGGKVMTLGDAYEKMSKVIRKFIETIRDIVTITKTQRVSKPDLEVAIADLVAISLAIQSMFRKESLIDRKFMENYKNEIAQDPDKQSLTGEKPAENLGLAGKGLEKLRSFLGTSLNYLGEKFLNLFATKYEQAKTEEEMAEVKEIIQWIKTKDQLAQMAISSFTENLMDIHYENQLKLTEQVDIPEDFKTKMSDVASRTFLDESTIDVDMVQAFESMQDPREKDSILRLMNDEAQELADHISSLFTVPEELIGQILDTSDGGESDAPPPGSVEIGDETEDDDGVDVEEPPTETGDSDLPPPPPDSDEEQVTPEEVQKAEEIIQKYKAKMGIPEEAKGILKPLLPPESMEKLGKDSIEVLAAIIKIAEIYINNAKGDLGDLEPMEESVSKIFNKIKKSANTFMNNRKVKKEFSDWKGTFESYLPDGKLKDAKEYLIFLLKFIKGDNLASILLQLSYFHGNIDLAAKAEQGFNNSNKTETDDASDLEESLKPIIEKMLKEHYNY